MISFQQLGMAFGQRLLFCEVDLLLNTPARYALVGANGAGKSTFFKLITGEDECTTGEVTLPREASIGWLKQDQFRYEDTRLVDIVLQGKQALWEAMQEKEALLLTEEWSEKDGFRFAALEEIILHHDGYSAFAKAASILSGLGIPEVYHEKPLKALSGGYKLRVLLAQALFQQPSILLLDEPTNHLDIVSIQWLEQFLIHEFKGLLIFISHDLDFIDHLATTILDIDFGEIRPYIGSYANFLAEKALLQEQKMAEKKSAEDKVAHMRAFVERFGAKASKASQARARTKMIEKIEIPDVLQSSRIAPHFQLTPQRPSGKMVFKLEQVSKAYQGKTLLNGLNLEIKRGEKWAILGENGRGKSTLMKIIMGLCTPDAGHVQVGHEVRVSYCSQDHHELLHESMTVLEWLEQAVPTVTEQQIRRLLGQVLFKKEDVQKNILALSGGESARLLLAKVMLERPNVLLLDEPTNHMDIETIDALTLALQQYTGTVLLVSHNRHFVEQVVDRVLYFSNHQKDEWRFPSRHPMVMI